MVRFKWIEVSVVCTRLTFWDFRAGLFPKGLIHGLYPIQSTHTRLRPPRCAVALAWILQDVTQRLKAR